MESSAIRKRMNREFRVKVNRGSVSILVGWQGLVAEVGLFRAKSLVCEALACSGDCYTWRARRGLIVRFYGK